MRLRNWINHNSIAVTCGSLSLLVGSLWYLQVRMAPPVFVAPTSAYFYDTVTSELFVANISEIAPIPTPAGNMVNDRPAGVRAYVFSCSSCSDAKSRFVGYLETYTDEAREAQLKLDQDLARAAADTSHLDIDPNASPDALPDEQTVNTISKGHLFASVKDIKTWVADGTDESIALITTAVGACGPGKYATQCQPDQQ